MMVPEILTFGEIIWDVYTDKSYIGGAGLNFAAHCQKCQAESYIFSAVGEDELGNRAEKVIHDFNIHCDFLKKTKNNTGKCMVTLGSNGMPEYNVLEDAAYDNIIVNSSDILSINQKEFDALCFGTLIQRSAVSAKSLLRIVKECKFKEIVCDINLRENCYDKESVQFCLENATILKISEEEEPLLKELGVYSDSEKSLEDVARTIALEFKQIKYIIFTLGEKGCFVYSSKDGTFLYQRSEKVKVASTVGAGDSFLAAWVTAYLSGMSPEVATKLAVALSGFVVSCIEAIPEYSIENIKY